MNENQSCGMLIGLIAISISIGTFFGAGYGWLLFGLFFIIESLPFGKH